MSYQTILLEASDGVARLTLNRPERLNSFDTTMLAEVKDAIEAARVGAARVLIITGAGRGFCAGQDLGDRAVAPGREKADLGAFIEHHYKPLMLALRRLPLPVLAAVNGVAAGAGANIALACDLVVAARSASFVQAFSRIALVPDCGGTWFLPRLVGEARALGLAMLGQKLSAQQAAEWGLIWRCIDDEDFPGEVDTIARQLACAPTGALTRTRQLLRDGWSRTLEQQLDAERDAQRELGFGADYAEGMAAFIEKREPNFTGR